MGRCWETFTITIKSCGPLHGPSRDTWRVPCPSFRLVTCLLGPFPSLFDYEVLHNILQELEFEIKMVIVN